MQLERVESLRLRRTAIGRAPILNNLYMYTIFFVIIINKYCNNQLYTITVYILHIIYYKLTS